MQLGMKIVNHLAISPPPPPVAFAKTQSRLQNESRWIGIQKPSWPLCPFPDLRSLHPPCIPCQFQLPYLLVELGLRAGRWLVGLGVHADVEQLAPSPRGWDCPQPQQELPPTPHGLLQRGAPPVMERTPQSTPSVIPGSRHGLQASLKRP